MKVKVLTSIASSLWSYGPGDVVEISEAEAASWIEAGIAVPAEEVEVAIKEATEDTAVHRGRPRRR
jgi:hypothetical protein